MNISVKEGTVLSVFHPDAQDLFNSCSDLKKVAWELWNPNYRLNDKVRSSPSNCTILILMTVFRTKQYSFSAPSRPCSASVPQRSLKTQ